MPGPPLVLELGGDPSLARDLAWGRVVVAGCRATVGEERELVVRVGDAEVPLRARVLLVDAGGAEIELVDCDPQMRSWLAETASLGAAPALVPVEPSGDDATTPADASAENGGAADDARKIPANVHERLRGLTIVEQLRIAQHGDVSERVVLERIYGKTVWEALLRNPRITGPEVARIARMGALPRTLVEIVVGNGAWIQIGEVRRALLSNPRLGTDQILRVLRLLAKHELKVAAMQTAYPQAVRDAAKRLLREKG